MVSDRSILTEKQAKVLEIIEKEILRHGTAPTFRSLAKLLGVKAVGTVQDYVKKLIELGFLEKEEGQYRGFRLPIQTKITWVPILGVVPAGKPIEAIQDYQGSLSLSGNWKGELFALEVRGESMTDKGILEGDFVIVRKGAEVQDGDIVVAMINGEATVKTFERKKGRVRLLPAHPHYQPIELHEEQENQVVGKVIGVQRHYSS